MGRRRLESTGKSSGRGCKVTSGPTDKDIIEGAKYTVGVTRAALRVCDKGVRFQERHLSSLSTSNLQDHRFKPGGNSGCGNIRQKER